jgi:RNA polymerase sigma-70 factor (sigma-B/F/G subfamily)
VKEVQVDLEIALSTRGDSALVELSGVLDHASVPYLRQVTFTLFDQARRHVIFEMSNLRLLDAASIKVLLYLARRAEQLDATVQVAGAAGTVLEVLEVTGVAKQLGVYDEFRWPVRSRQREAVELDKLHVAHRFWPELADAFAALSDLEPDDPHRQQLRNQIIEQCLPAAHRLARRFGGIGEPTVDLFQVAAMGLVKAVDGFDPSRGIEFATYATPTIVGELKRHFRDRSWGIRLPRRLQELRLAVNKGRDELTQRLGRSPTIDDLAEHIGVDAEQVLEVLEAGHTARPMSLDSPVLVAEDDLTLADTVGSDDPEYSHVDYRESLHVLMDRLPPREQKIISLRFYGNLTQVEIAEKVGLSQMHVSRLLRQSLEFLKRGLGEP